MCCFYQAAVLPLISMLTETALQKTDGNLSSVNLQDGPEAVKQLRVPNPGFDFLFVKDKFLMCSLLSVDICSA